jgi:hypothetical protein
MSFVFTWVVLNTKRALGHWKKEEESIRSQKSAKNDQKNVLTHIPLSARILGPYSQQFFYLRYLKMGPISWNVTLPLPRKAY